MKKLIVLAAALTLSGCGLPPAITIVSYALDGLSLLSTGKSVGDHAISVAARQDCAMWRLVKNGEICRDFEAGEKGPVVVAVGRWERGTEIVGLTEPEPLAVHRAGSKPILLAVADPEVLPEFSGKAVGAGLAIRFPAEPIADPFVAIEPAPGAGLLARALTDAPWLLPVGLAPVEAIERAHERTRTPRFKAPDTLEDASIDSLAPPSRHQKVLVLGSFTRLANAKRIARRWSGFRPAIVRTRLGGGTVHRVIIGAVDGNIDRRRRQLASAGQKVWAADVCAAGSLGDRCVVLPAVLRR